MSKNETHLLFGEFVLNTESGHLVHVVGKGKIGKTTTCHRASILSNGRYSVVVSDRATLHVPTRQVQSDEGVYLPNKLDRLAHFKGKGGEYHEGLTMSLAFSMMSLGLTPIDFTRLERDPEQTAIHFLKFLDSITK